MMVPHVAVFEPGQPLEYGVDQPDDAEADAECVFRPGAHARVARGFAAISGPALSRTRPRPIPVMSTLRRGYRWGAGSSGPAAGTQVTTYGGYREAGCR